MTADRGTGEELHQFSMLQRRRVQVGCVKLKKDTKCQCLCRYLGKMSLTRCILTVM